jgi:hypothetical protein
MDKSKMERDKIEDIATIIGGLSVLIIWITSIIWGLAVGTDLIKNFKYWLIDLFYSHKFYGEYNKIVRGNGLFWRISGVYQPIFNYSLVNLSSFTKTNERNYKESSWLSIMELTSCTKNHISLVPNEYPKRDLYGKVMLKVNLENLQQLLIRDTISFNYDIPWINTWRQKTAFGHIEIFFKDRILQGNLNIDPEPFHEIPHCKQFFDGDQVNYIWNHGYIGFSDIMFTDDISNFDNINFLLEFITNVKTINIKDIKPKTHAISTCLLSIILRNLGIVTLKKNKCKKHFDKWVEIGNISINFSSKILWIIRKKEKGIISELSNIGYEIYKKSKIILDDGCNDCNDCNDKYKVSNFTYELLTGTADWRYLPSWTYKRSWYGPTAVYFCDN